MREMRGVACNASLTQERTRERKQPSSAQLVRLGRLKPGDRM